MYSALTVVNRVGDVLRMTRAGLEIVSIHQQENQTQADRVQQAVNSSFIGLRSIEMLLSVITKSPGFSLCTNLLAGSADIAVEVTRTVRSEKASHLYAKIQMDWTALKELEMNYWQMVKDRQLADIRQNLWEKSKLWANLIILGVTLGAPVLEVALRDIGNAEAFTRVILNEESSTLIATLAALNAHVIGSESTNLCADPHVQKFGRAIYENMESVADKLAKSNLGQEVHEKILIPLDAIMLSCCELTGEFLSSLFPSKVEPISTQQNNAEEIKEIYDKPLASDWEAIPRKFLSYPFPFFCPITGKPIRTIVRLVNPNPIEHTTTGYYYFEKEEIQKALQQNQKPSHWPSNLSFPCAQDNVATWEIGQEGIDATLQQYLDRANNFNRELYNSVIGNQIQINNKEG